MAVTFAYPDQVLNTASNKNAQKEAGLGSPSEAVLHASDFGETAGKCATPSKNRDSFLSVLLRALGSPHS